MNGLMTIDYEEADDLSIIISSYVVKGKNVYDITISQTFSLIRQSSDSQVATQWCDAYMKQAHAIAKEEFGNIGSKLAEHARMACIDDVSVTGDRSWAQSSINFVTMDALRVSRLEAKLCAEEIIGKDRYPSTNATEIYQ
ncbi:hypothetical protein I4U23_020252 [Adineta vaga]|nr:hypothetical protein I4U23_020252 [Adineta vaga]